jgi:hypothetical protein
MSRLRGLAVATACCVFVGIATSCGSDQSKGIVVAQEGSNGVPSIPVSPRMVEGEEFATTRELIRHSYVVARGRFIDGPRVVAASPEGEELAAQVVVWEFVPDKVYRDVRRPNSPARRAGGERGSILVAARANEIGVMRGDQPLAEFVRYFESIYNLNSFPVDVPLYIFLRRGAMSQDIVEQNPDLEHVMGVTGLTQCYRVDDLARSCAYAADVPGGEPGAALDEGVLVPGDLDVDGIERAASVAEVVALLPNGEPNPAVDTERYEVVSGGGEG